MASILQLMMHCHFSHTLVDTEHLILLLVPICVRCCLFFSRSGAEGSQGALFCREGRWEQAEVSEWETREQKKTLAESQHFFPRWERGMSWRNSG